MNTAQDIKQVETTALFLYLENQTARYKTHVYAALASNQYINEYLPSRHLDDRYCMCLLYKMSYFEKKEFISPFPHVYI